MLKFMYLMKNGAYSENPIAGAKLVCVSTEEEIAAHNAALAKAAAKRKGNAKPKKYKKAKKAKALYWNLEYKTGSQEPLQKYVCVVDVDSPDHYKWKPYTYSAIAKSDYYGNKTVKMNDAVYTVRECIEEVYPKYRDRINEAIEDGNTSRSSDLIKRAAAFKERLDTVLDGIGRRFAHETKQKLYTADKKIAMAENYQHNPTANQVIACYPVKDSAYHGVITKPTCGRLRVTEYTDVRGMLLYSKPIDDGEFIINTNSSVKLDTLLCDSAYKDLYALIELGNVFGVAPKLIEGFWRLDSYKFIIRDEECIYQRPEGVFGYTITKEAYAEFQATVNYYVGMAESGVDLSDEVTLHHPDGVRTLNTTKYWCYKNPDKAAEYREDELRDFQYEQSKAVDEYEVAADVLDDNE